MTCFNSKSKRFQLTYEATANINEIFRNRIYTITDSTNGMHGDIFRCIACGVRFIGRTNFTEDLIKHYYQNQSGVFWILTNNFLILILTLLSLLT